MLNFARQLFLRTRPYPGRALSFDRFNEKMFSDIILQTCLFSETVIANRRVSE